MENDGPVIRRSILDLLESRDKDSSICPSEVARAMFPNDWRDRMNDVREIAGQLVREGVIEVTQKKKAVDPETARGPIRLRLKSGSSRS